MPIYEYYCPDNHTVYQFYAKTLAQGRTTPRCPDNPRFRMEKRVSAFAITRGASAPEPAPKSEAGAETDHDAKREAAEASLEQEFSNLDDNDPKAMARMLRRMSEVSGDKIEGQFEEVVRKLEEGADPESLDEQLDAADAGEDSGDPLGGGMGLDPGTGRKGAAHPKEARHRYRIRQLPPRRDPKLYDYE